MDNEIIARWNGPYSWPKFGNNPASAFNSPGIYLWTYEYQQGFLVYCAGITRRPIKERLSEHTRSFLRGAYTLLDMDSIKKGVRNEVWHGLWATHNSPERQAEFSRRRDELEVVARNQLSNYRVFVADIGTQPRHLERFESAIMDLLYDMPMPFSGIPDRGMMLSRRWKNEDSINIVNEMPVKIYGLPQRMEI